MLTEIKRQIRRSRSELPRARFAHNISSPGAATPLL